MFRPHHLQKEVPFIHECLQPPQLKPGGRDREDLSGIGLRPLEITTNVKPVDHKNDWQLFFRAKVNPQAAVGDGWANV